MFSRVRIIRGMLALLTCMIMSKASAQTTWYVATNGNDAANSGTNGWEDAFITISNAIAKSASLDTVLVGPGEYVLTASISIPVEKIIHLLGVGGPSNTIINGNAPAYEIRGIYALNGRIGGFTITNAFYDPATSADGGGAYIGANAIMTNCIFMGNYAGRYGGGAIVYGGVLHDCIFRRNRSGLNGGGVTVRVGGDLYDCLIDSNEAVNSSGGCYVSGGSQVSNCVMSDNISEAACGGAGSDDYGSKYSKCWIYGNTAETFGGGCYIGEGGIMTDCVISGNVAGAYGGGGWVGQNSILRNSIICDNQSMSTEKVAGGGVYIGYTNALMLNCLVYRNQAPYGGGGGVAMAHDGDVDACTIASNYAGQAGGGIYTHWSASGDFRLFIRNSIVYSNDAPVGPNWSGLNTQYTWFTNSCITNPAMPQGSEFITDYPKFVDPASNNYRLASGSPCINMGWQQEWMKGDVDLDGRPRLDRFSRLADIGCYEYVFPGTMFQFK